MADLDAWFAKFESAPRTRTGVDSEAVAIAANVDALCLPWCGDGVTEITGGLLPDPSRLHPLLCRGCTLFDGARCQVLGVAPGPGHAGRCQQFQPRPGVTVGHCWLWRIELNDGRLIWWSKLPPARQSEAIAWARQYYGDAVQAVAPLPGLVEVPSA